MLSYYQAVDFWCGSAIVAEIKGKLVVVKSSGRDVEEDSGL